jgi:hypothetical protein
MEDGTDEAKKQVAQDAAQMAGEFRRHSTGLESEQLVAKLKALEVEASLLASNLAAQRLQSFHVTIGGELQCPRCWIAHEVNSPLVPQSCENKIDQLMCQVCHYELSA